MSFNQNQFSKSVTLGQIDYSRGGINNSFTFRIDPDSASSDIVAGTGVSLKDGGANDAGGVPYVDVTAADNVEATAGVIIYTPKQGKFQPGDIVQCAQDGDVVWMNAAAALSRGVYVSLDVSTAGDVKAVGTDAQFGITLDKATGAGQLIRVKIKTAAA